MLKIYHYPSCSKSRGILQFLDEKTIPYKIVNFMENPLSVEELKILFEKLGTEVKEIIRDNQGKDKIFPEQWLELLLANPSLMQRPILETENTAIIGRPIERVEEFINGLS